MFASQSEMNVLQLRAQLQLTKKGFLSISAYYLKMKALVDKMAASGNVLSDKELALYILGGLGS